MLAFFWFQLKFVSQNRRGNWRFVRILILSRLNVSRLVRTERSQLLLLLQMCLQINVKRNNEKERWLFENG